ncbi:LCP family protein [Quadrisphaera sp. INWT6]|uniref:LCP family protein n=1 Tax=Quadrisphaera sp. INWT6 TaxID=2596917 RepID=UPI001892001A|nr:LCP family protein [Quadrisphaera sp. INWT6]MBF5083101.1 LytR family transcriptional regulator [Quadrisphaera sp. INWT6]
MTVTEPGSYPRRRDVRDARTSPGGRPARPAAADAPRGATATAVRTPAPRRPVDGAEGTGTTRGPAAGPTEGAGDVSLIHAGDDPRGRHASGAGEGFTRLVLLTVLGAAVPGTGLIAAGRRVSGWLVLLPVLAAVGALLAVVGTGRLVPLAQRVVFDPQAMLVVAVGALALAAVWALVIVTSHASLRSEVTRGGLTRAQRLASLLLVTALVAVVAAPSATAARYAMANRSLLMNVFGHDSDGGTGPNTAAADPWADVPRVNVLLLGADTGSDRVGTRPDTIIVASIDTKTGSSTLLSLPRQLEDVPFPEGSKAQALWPTACKEDGTGGCMLNAVYLFGSLHPDLFGGTANGNDPGIEATKQAVAEATGLPISYEVKVDLEGFQQLVDAMGGITLNVPRDIPIGGGTNLETGGKYKITGWIEEGPDQKLDGYHALWFARSREGSDNDDRMRRQQCVISAAVQQYDVAQLAAKFPALASAAEQNIQTDIPYGELSAFVDLGQRVKGGDLRALSFTKDNISTGNPDYAALRQLVADAIAPAPAATAAVTATTSVTPAPAPSPSATASADQAVDPTTTC